MEKDEGIFIINKDKVEKNTQKETILYCISGYGQEKDDEGFLTIVKGKVDERYIGAKIENGNFYVRMSESNRFYNPNHFNSLEERQYISSRGKSMFNFKKVKEESFRQYLAFLRTRNTIHLSNAERSL